MTTYQLFTRHRHWLLLIVLCALLLAGCRAPAAEPTPTVDSDGPATTSAPESGVSLSTPAAAATSTPPDAYPPPPAATTVLPDPYPPPAATAIPVTGYPPPAATSALVEVPLPPVQSQLLPELPFTPSADTCLPHDRTAALGADLWGGAEPELVLEAFLNGGGTVELLPERLAAVAPSEPPVLLQVASHDLTADGVPEVLVALTRPYGSGDGETHLALFYCQDGRYETQLLFRRAGAGGRAEGLYDGGGAVVESFQDLNGNGVPDLLFSVRWPNYTEVYLLEWDGAEFDSLISYTDLLGEAKNRLEVVDGHLALSDPDGDGVQDLVVVEICSGAQAERKTFWRWDGTRFHHDGDLPPSPGC